jgi:hypothetical protein
METIAWQVISLECTLETHKIQSHSELRIRLDIQRLLAR